MAVAMKATKAMKAVAMKAVAMKAVAMKVAKAKGTDKGKGKGNIVAVYGEGPGPGQVARVRTRAKDSSKGKTAGTTAAAGMKAVAMKAVKAMKAMKEAAPAKKNFYMKGVAIEEDEFEVLLRSVCEAIVWIFNRLSIFMPLVLLDAAMKACVSAAFPRRVCVWKYLP
jgi:hypothetical protein